MPIKIPNDLPAFEKLQQEGVRLIGENEALRQDIRPMQVALLNLMPEKPKTETQLARLLGATPLQVELTLLTTSHLSAEHRAPVAPAVVLPDLGGRARPQVRRPDHHRRAGRAVAVRGGQVLAGADADPRLVAHATCTARFHICWGAQAALYHFHGVPKHPLPTKRFGVFTHHVIERRRPASPGTDARLRRLFPGAGLAPHRGASGRPAARWRPRGAGGLATRPACAWCTSPRTARSTCSTTSSTTPTPCTTSICRDRTTRPDVSLPINYYPDDDPEKRAAQLLARLRPSAVRQLDQRDVPDHAL